MGVSKKAIKFSSATIENNDSPIRAVFCLKRKVDMAKFEEVEECFILDFDPSERSPLSKISKSSHLSLDHDDGDDLSILGEKGQVACRDYPHPRHLCVKFPFEKTPHEKHCPMCYCYVCDTAAPCKQWTIGIKHCDATRNGSPIWKALKDLSKKAKNNPK